MERKPCIEAPAQLAQLRIKLWIRTVQHVACAERLQQLDLLGAPHHADDSDSEALPETPAIAMDASPVATTAARVRAASRRAEH